MKKQNGFTLVEVLATVAVSTMVMFVLFAAVINFEEILNFTDQNVEAQREHRLIRERFGRYIRNSVWAEDHNDELRLDLDDYEQAKEEGIALGQDGNGLYYRWCQEESGGNINWGDGTDITFTSGDVTVDEFSIDIEDDTAVIIKVVLNDGNRDYEFTEIFYLRNIDD